MPEFDEIFVLQVSYSDVPDKAYEVFVSALTSNYLKRGLVIPSLVKVHNPAGNLMVSNDITGICSIAIQETIELSH